MHKLLTLLSLFTVSSFLNCNEFNRKSFKQYMQLRSLAGFSEAKDMFEDEMPASCFEQDDIKKESIILISLVFAHIQGTNKANEIHNKVQTIVSSTNTITGNDSFKKYINDYIQCCKELLPSLFEEKLTVLVDESVKQGSSLSSTRRLLKTKGHWKVPENL